MQAGTTGTLPLTPRHCWLQ